MTKIHRRKLLRPNQTGRSMTEARHIRLYHWMLKSAAWQSLSLGARCLFLEVYQRFNGLNNGEISLSVREAGEKLKISKNTAAKFFKELEQKGFLKVRVKGAFHWKKRHATEWILTTEGFNDGLPTKEFMRWQPLAF